MEPEKYSDLKLYGNKGVFERKFKQGYTEVAFGRGPWVPGDLDEKRIVGIWVFYHPNGKIATLETPKFYADSHHTIHGYSFETEYGRFRGKLKFESHVKEFKIELGKKHSLQEIIERWNV